MQQVRSSDLGSILTEVWRHEVEIKERFQHIDIHLIKKKRQFCSSKNLEIRKRLVKCYMWNVLLYRCKT